MAQDLMDSGLVAACGFHGPALQPLIPGIPFPLGADFQGDQEQDAGLHMSLYNRPGDAHKEVAYTPPDLQMSLALVGLQVQFGVEQVTILNANETNDLKTGVCYYVSIACDQRATVQANEIQRKVGLPIDVTQKFHMTIAGLAPAWIECHPKSSSAKSGDQQLKSRLATAYKLLRRGDSDLDFAGFNDDVNTGWTKHADTCAQWARENAALREKIKALPHDDYAEKAQLESQLREIKNLGFCKPVGPAEQVKSISTPSVVAQLRVVQQFVCPVNDGELQEESKSVQTQILHESTCSGTPVVKTDHGVGITADGPIAGA